MKNIIIDSDMALDNLLQGDFKDIAQVKNLSHNITEYDINVKDNEVAKRVSKDIGLYITFDTKNCIYNSYKSFLTRRMAYTMLNMIGNLPKNAKVLVVGLGNSDIVADSLGAKVCNNLMVNCDNFSTRLCAIKTGVSSKTGIDAKEIALGVVDRIKPNAVIVVDALATSNVIRLGTSYQLTTAGISPGSGVYSERPTLSKKTLGVPTIAIGVPFNLSMRSLVSICIKDYCEKTNENIDEFAVKNTIEDNRLLRLIVSPKETNNLVENSASIIADAINIAFTK